MQGFLLLIPVTRVPLDKANLQFSSPADQGWTAGAPWCTIEIPQIFGINF